MQAGPYRQPPPMRAGPYGQPLPMQAGPYEQRSPMQAGPYEQPSPMQAGPYEQPLPMQAGPYEQPSPMQAGPYEQPLPMQAGPYEQPLPMQAGPYEQPSPMQAKPYEQPSPMQAGPYGPAQYASVWCDPRTQMQPPLVHAPYPYQHQWPPQGMMPGMPRAGVPLHCQSPTKFCPGFHSYYMPCAWSCPASAFFDQAMPGRVDPAAQLGAVRDQLLTQLAAAGGEQRGIGQGMAPTTVVETDRLIEELEATVHQLRAHRAALERLAGG